MAGARRLAIALVLAAVLADPMPLYAQQAVDAVPPAENQAVPAEDKPTPYDERLMRLSEILGSLHYLRNLCKGGEDTWRNRMQAFIELEAGKEPARKRRMTAAFNRGWRGFASVYTTCTPQALEAEARYRAEGATLANEIIARFGN